MKKTNLILLFVLFATITFAQAVKPVKNVILMIPDGTSIGVYSAARWYKIYNNMGDALHVDPYTTGTLSVKMDKHLNQGHCMVVSEKGILEVDLEENLEKVKAVLQDVVSGD